MSRAGLAADRACCAGLLQGNVLIRGTNPGFHGTGYRYMSWTNTNKLLGSYAGTMGIKTGSGPAVGYCLVLAAVRGGKTVIGTVVASSSESTRTADAEKLLDYGFKK